MLAGQFCEALLLPTATGVLVAKLLSLISPHRSRDG
jgi:hypothetical protein